MFGVFLKISYQKNLKKIKNKLSRVIHIMLAFLLYDFDTEQASFLCLGEDITHIQKEW